MHKTVGVVAGSFDPVTLGHAWLFQEAAKLVNELHIVVGVNSAKRYHFTDAQRVNMVEAIVAAELSPAARERTHIHLLRDDLLVRFAKTVGGTHFVRGIRDVQDLAYEQGNAAVNHKLDPTIQTVYLMTPADKLGISSTVIRELMRYPDWEESLVPFAHPSTIELLRCMPKKEG
jgi:pantetheine-phosphate adenylyltransferase